MTERAKVLGIVDRGYRGAVEKQFVDSLYLVRELHRQMGGVDILLRGEAASYAARGARVAPLRFGSRVVEQPADPRRDVLALLAAGIRVRVEEPGLLACGLTGADRLVDGVERISAEESARAWSDYEMVCFL
ncbi:hypothetical protein HUT16_27940 [Kitasatospora sp. NA04385]|uniref:hypothetical protein n=1 Tax=Kitasatospora sp. NA04385 TaxID=2742135 RepID=UPI001162BB48|nr:hypothetical protein [Kitasatospora sp. NA04385]QDJ74269.1 DsrE/DsrF-like family protein [Kitasatospora sp.]QKW22402.1 hypothetical protein HUT16_27940 [Kitasatospora sp. NA04385]